MVFVGWVCVVYCCGDGWVGGCWLYVYCGEFCGGVCVVW